MFDGLYKTDREKETFVSRFCGPDVLPHGERTLVAYYPKNPKDGDGQPVKVYCCALPARFYIVEALPSTNSVGEEIAGFTLSTGSSLDDWAAETAHQISQGMVALG